MYGGQNTHIPLKLAMAGVMPVIFASSFMTFPAMIIQMFNANRIIKKAFVPPTTEEYIVKYSRGEFPWFREKKDNEIRALYVDFAFTDTVSENSTADNTVIGCMSGYPNENKTRFLRNCDYMETYSCSEKDESLLRIRELFFYYDVDVVLVDLHRFTLNPLNCWNVLRAS